MPLKYMGISWSVAGLFSRSLTDSLVFRYGEHVFTYDSTESYTLHFHFWSTRGTESTLCSFKFLPSLHDSSSRGVFIRGGSRRQVWRICLSTKAFYFGYTSIHQGYHLTVQSSCLVCIFGSALTTDSQGRDSLPSKSQDWAIEVPLVAYSSVVVFDWLHTPSSLTPGVISPPKTGSIPRAAQPQRFQACFQLHIWKHLWTHLSTTFCLLCGGFRTLYTIIVAREGTYPYSYLTIVYSFL